MNFAGDAAVCPDMARANHSCRPNAGRWWQYIHFFITTYYSTSEFVTRVWSGEQVLVVMYVVEAGEEVINILYNIEIIYIIYHMQVTINYLDMEQEGADTRETRRDYLRTSYGFCCTCRACTLQVTPQPSLYF